MSSVSQTSSSVKPLTSDRSILMAAKGGGIVLIGRIFSYALRLFIGILMTRLLGAEEFGLYRLALTAATIGAWFWHAGSGVCLRSICVIIRKPGRFSTAGGTLQVGLGLVTFMSLVIGACLYALATPISIHLFEDARLIPLLRIGSMIVPLISLSKALITATHGFNQMQYAIISQDIVQPLLRLVLIGIITIVGLNAANSLGIFIVGLFATCGLLLFFLNRLFPLRRSFRSAIRDVRGLLRYSLPAYFSVLLDTFQSNFQTIFLGSLNTIFTVGVFSVAAQVSRISEIFNASIGTASSPIVSELHDQEDTERIARFYQTTTKWMFTMNLPIFLIVLLFSGTILSLFGEDFVEGTAVLLILMWGNLVVAVVGIADGVLNMTGNTHFRLTNSIINISLMLILSFLLIPTWGAIGAAITSLISKTVVNLLRVIQVFIKLKMLPYNLSYIKPVLAGVVAFIIGWFTNRMFQTEANLVAAALNALEILSVYIGVIFLLGLSPEDRIILASAQKRIRSKFSRN